VSRPWQVGDIIENEQEQKRAMVMATREKHPWDWYVGREVFVADQGWWEQKYWEEKRGYTLVERPQQSQGADQ
jgi:hypothetical protein